MTDLDRAEQLAAAATAGPWDTDESVCCVYEPVDNRCIAQVAISADGTEADAEFIAAARELVPALVARVRALTDAGNTLAAETLRWVPTRAAAGPLAAWRALVDTDDPTP